MVIGTCGKKEVCTSKDGGLYIVRWIECDRITVPAVGLTIATNTRSREEAIAICRRNLQNFVEA